ncbi:aminodeoxychorismate synthase component I [Runella slithyformis]|uniref:Chorismate binding domain-containing protein n=1 Tax=Runella slithyformis (strain ATCC 29530 / DSM 19594 / LMG 11500 / NCIMB 11436 / LSU 4) TaxID=761193 RepID=A0A7U3ZHB9_RUNSL|nr:aminodeoxychorismate synthase component I [Runella slithyformis]AEI47205.1 Chorismate binding domain-containing protein [Runella slithyformis DSM 19594]
MIPILTASEAILQMNAYGSARVPFLFIIDFSARYPVVLRLDELKADEVLYDFNGATNATKANELFHTPVQFGKNALSFEEYLPKFDYVVHQLKRGNSFLVNLSVCTKITTDLDLQTIFNRTKAKYRLWWRDRFVCFSPEIFVQVRGNRMASFPMKGTIDADLPLAKERILADVKEAAEHATIVDLIRNDLSMVAQKVWVERYRFIEAIATNQKTLLQVSSEIAGLLPDDWRETVGTWLFKLLPAGSVSGAPKPSTLAIIQQAEGYERGYYTGVAGIFDGENLDSGVLIRFIENSNGQLFFKSGGGITARSEARSEYREIIDKVYLPLAHEFNPVH